jgi:hypothetical protein
MKDLDRIPFIDLFKEAYEKCFGFPFSAALSETDSKVLSDKILEHTGLVIGYKSLKNYSLNLQKNDRQEHRHANPSVATLDTLARYVLDAPSTNEIKRKQNESHHPYWFQYSSRYSPNKSILKQPQRSRRIIAAFSLISLIILSGIFVISIFKKSNDPFSDEFNTTHEDSLKSNGWMIKSRDTLFWNKRNEKSGHISLYTLKGDNWSLDKDSAEIRNLLIRRISSDCFMVETHLTHFVPGRNWQQAGIILSEDSTFKSKMLRISISFNDFFGGYPKPAEIIIQIIGSSESGWLSKPEEIAHIPLFTIEPGKEDLAESNLAKSALKIEKIGTKYRFFYTAASLESFTFKEAFSGDFNIHPKYVSLFSISGWADDDDPIPAYFDFFRLLPIRCND